MAPVVPGFPPLTVPLTGAAPDPRIGARWVSFTSGKLGEPPECVWLDHFYPGMDRGLRVGNLPRERYAEYWANRDAPTALAFSAMFTLTETARPQPRVPISNTRQIAFVEAQSDQWQTWPTITLTLHGAPAQCPIAHFAGNWVALVDDDPHSHLIVHGHGMDPTEVDLTRVTTDAYGFAADHDTPGGAAGPPGNELTFAPNSTPRPHPDWEPFLD